MSIKVHYGHYGQFTFCLPKRIKQKQTYIFCFKIFGWKLQSLSFDKIVPISGFFKENVRYPVWTCRDRLLWL